LFTITDFKISLVEQNEQKRSAFSGLYLSQHHFKHSCSIQKKIRKKAVHWKPQTKHNDLGPSKMVPAE